MIGARLSRALRATPTAAFPRSTTAFQRLPALRVQRGYASAAGVKESRERVAAALAHRPQVGCRRDT